MSLSGALYEELIGNAGVSAIVGTKVYDTAAVEDPTLPYITYFGIGAEHVDHMTAASGMVATTIQVDCWHDDSHDRDTLAEAVRAALHHFSGTLGTGVATATVGHIHITGDRPGYTPPEDETEFGTFVQQTDYTIWHTETVPSV